MFDRCCTEAQLSLLTVGGNNGKPSGELNLTELVAVLEGLEPVERQQLAHALGFSNEEEIFDLVERHLNKMRVKNYEQGLMQYEEYKMHKVIYEQGLMQYEEYKMHKVIYEQRLIYCLPQ